VRVFANGSALACALMPRRPPTGPRAAPHDSACKPNRLQQHESMIRETLPSPRLREKGAKLATSFTMSKNFCLPRLADVIGPPALPARRCPTQASPRRTAQPGAACAPSRFHSSANRLDSTCRNPSRVARDASAGWEIFLPFESRWKGPIHAILYASITGASTALQLPALPLTASACRYCRTRHNRSVDRSSKKHWFHFFPISRTPFDPCVVPHV
jgi:hypothetical protein